jgi:hypothetical protein
VLGAGGENRQTEAFKFRRAPIVFDIVALVGGDDTGYAGFTHTLDNLAVERRNPLSGVDDYDADRRILDRQRRLIAGFLVKRIVRNALIERDAAGIDQHHFTSLNLNFSRNPVTGNARLIENDGDPFSRDTVEKSAFTGVRPPD